MADISRATRTWVRVSGRGVLVINASSAAALETQEGSLLHCHNQTCLGEIQLYSWLNLLGGRKLSKSNFSKPKRIGPLIMFFLLLLLLMEQNLFFWIPEETKRKHIPGCPQLQPSRHFRLSGRCFHEANVTLQASLAPPDLEKRQI